jgi:probable aminopeptidase NPEPL1
MSTPSVDITNEHSLAYFGAIEADKLAACDKIVFVGEHDHLAAAATNGVFTSLGLGDAVQAAALKECRAGKDAPKSSTTLVSGADGVTRVTFASLPTAVARHNSAARPHAITSVVKSAVSACDEAVVVLVLPDSTRAFASGSAVPRAFSEFTHKASGTGSGLCSVMFHCLNGDAVDTSVFSPVSDGIKLASRIVDMPCDEMNTTAFVDVASQVASSLPGVSLEVITGTELRDRGFGGMWGVGKAASHPPSLAILRTWPAGEEPPADPVVFVGKGIVYDTGGLSIKTKTGMPGMKRDCGGAAGVLGAFQAAVAGNVTSTPLACILCLAENAVGPDATRPDDILHMYSGRTVEVNNTDAEGRLVLGDGVAYAVKHLHPATIVDMATLTGAQLISTGRRHAALYCNDDALEAALLAAGKASGDLTHPLPYCPEFFRGEFASAVADMKNSVKDRSNAQSSCAGQFIGNHLGEYADTGKWCHVDIAGPSYAGERATGFGVALLVNWLMNRA